MNGLRAIFCVAVPAFSMICEFPPMKGSTMSELSSGQRKELRSLAHHLDPVVLIGNNGVTENLMRSIEAALDAHELIKIRFNEHKDSKKDLTAKIAADTGACVAGIIGHVAILYREHPKADKRKIRLKSS
jgi:RNA-binding protein